MESAGVQNLPPAVFIHLGDPVDQLLYNEVSNNSARTTFSLLVFKEVRPTHDPWSRLSPNVSQEEGGRRRSTATKAKVRRFQRRPSVLTKQISLATVAQNMFFSVPRQTPFKRR